MNDEFEKVWEDVVTQHLHVGTEEGDDKPVGIALVKAEIRTEHV